MKHYEWRHNNTYDAILCVEDGKVKKTFPDCSQQEILAFHQHQPHFDDWSWIFVNESAAIVMGQEDCLEPEHYGELIAKRYTDSNAETPNRERWIERIEFWLNIE